MIKAMSLIVCSVVFVIGGCCECFDEEASPGTTAAILASTAVNADAAVDTAGGAWGTVRGQIVYDGTPPERKPLDVNKDQDHCLSKGPILNETWAVNPANKGVRWVVAAIKPPQGKTLEIHPSLKTVSQKEVVLDQPCCSYEPRVVAIRQGQKLVAKNPSPKSHNVNVTGLRNNFNPNIPPGSSHTFDLLLEKNAIKLACGMHPWMVGWAWTFDHPYYAVTNADGRFEIKLVPAGNQHLMLWHEDVGWVAGGRPGLPIEVKAGEVTDLGKIATKSKK